MLLDRSMSMRHRGPSGGTLFDEAKKQAAEALSTFSERDDVALFLVDAHVNRLDAPLPESLGQRIAGLQPGYGETGMANAVERAVEWLEATEAPNRELYLFTDGARHGWADAAAMSPTSPEEATRSAERPITLFQAFHLPDASNNVSIDAISTSGSLLAPGSPAILQIDLRSHADRPRNDLTLTVDAGPTRVAQERVALAPGEERRLFISLTPERGGPLAITADIGADDLPDDSRRSSMLHVPDSLSVLLVGPANAATYYPLQALEAASAAEGRIRVRSVLPQELTPADIEGQSSIWLSNVERLSGETLSALRREVDAGVGVVVILGDAVDVRYYNAELLKDLIPSNLVAVTGSPHQGAGEPDAFRTFRLPFPDHPLFTGLVAESESESGGSQSPHFYAYYRVRLGTEARSLLTFSDGFPAVAEGRSGRGRVLLVTSAFDLAWSDLSLSGLMVPFAGRLARYLARDAAGDSDYDLGESVFRQLPGLLPKQGLLRPPSGDARTVWPEQQGRRSMWRVGEVEVPGLWEIASGGRVADRFAVGLDPAESDLSRIDQENLESLLPQARIVALVPGERTADQIHQTRYGRELWRLFLGAALAVAAAEMLLARSVPTVRPGGDDRTDNSD